MIYKSAYRIGFDFFFEIFFLSHMLLNQPRTYFINLNFKKEINERYYTHDFYYYKKIIILKNNKNIQFINLFIVVDECIYILKVDLFYYIY